MCSINPALPQPGARPVAPAGSQPATPAHPPVAASSYVVHPAPIANTAQVPGGGGAATAAVDGAANLSGLTSALGEIVAKLKDLIGKLQSTQPLGGAPAATCAGGALGAHMPFPPPAGSLPPIGGPTSNFTGRLTAADLIMPPRFAFDTQGTSADRTLAAVVAEALKPGGTMSPAAVRAAFEQASPAQRESITMQVDSMAALMLKTRSKVSAAINQESARPGGWNGQAAIAQIRTEIHTVRELVSLLHSGAIPPAIAQRLREVESNIGPLDAPTPQLTG